MIEPCLRGAMIDMAALAATKCARTFSRQDRSMSATLT